MPCCRRELGEKCRTSLKRDMQKKGQQGDRGAWEGLTCSVMSDSATSWTAAHQAPLSMEFPGKILECVAVPFSRGSSQPRMEPMSPVASALAGGFFTTVPPLGKPHRGMFSCKTCGALEAYHVASLGPHITVCLNVQASVFLILQVLGL